MNPSKMSVTMIISATFFVGVLAASFDVQGSGLGQAGNGPTHVKRTRSAEAPVQLCGFRLLEAVRVLCGGYFSGYSRRSDPGMPLMGGMMEEVMPGGMDENAPQYSNGEAYADVTGSDYSPDADPSNWNRNPKALALKVLAEAKNHQRFRRNIIDECCKRACTVTHMLKYCGRA